ncbi:hypothetical protein Nepgr_032439 [Nepenthes gracilis]|uniref:Nuclear matrix constituent protein 1-like protein n=1 Tax=Nepenthes gracilis TaxID=150966 RepID=A0AAD3TK12_NEPGR|nr:hypothetical protein Nepgr_032439 [Nepenthes gracilis]
MFMPKRRAWSGLSPAQARSENQKVTGLSSNSNPEIADGSVGKGKSVAFSEATTTGSGSLHSNGMEMEANRGDPKELAAEASKLENELFEYQYNMGLLLIEKKEWTSKYEDLQRALAEVKDTLKREQGAHLIAMSNIEERKENLRKALDVEKQCVLDLEKALREMRAEYAEIKFTANSKLAEANALAATIEEKSLQVEAKLHAADAKLAEASRKSSGIERKLQELESRENSLQKERLSFISEREANDATLSKRREDLLEWERKMQGGEERLAEAQRILKQREERANEIDRSCKQKEKYLEEAQKKINVANIDLRNKEDDIKSRLASLSDKEKEADDLKKRIEMKEKELLALEEKLNEREKTEIQKLLDEYQTELEAKKQQFELEMEQKIKDFDDELRSKAAEVAKKEVEINHMEEKLAKREEALEKKLGKLMEKEKDFETKSTSLKEREKSIRSEEKKLEVEKKEMLIDKESLANLKSELEQRRADIQEQLLKIQQEREQLKVTEEERSEHLRLQSELKQEIGKCRVQKELFMKEADELKQERESFEREWEALDVKKVEIEKELKKMTVEKEKLEKWRHSELERMRNENLTAQNNIKSELEALKLAKESFAEEMEREKSLSSERVRIERSQMLNDFEMRRTELEIEMQKKLDKMDKNLCERERLFEEERDRELNNANYLREVAGREMEDMKQERQRIEKQQQEVAATKKDLEGHRLEVQKDIEELIVLSSKLKDQREQFFKERERFITFIEKNQNCEKCGEISCAFVLSDLQILKDTERTEILPLPKLAEDYMRNGFKHALTPSQQQNNETTPAAINTKSSQSGGPMSWLQKCTSKIKIFKISPKQIKQSAMQNLAGESSSQVDGSANVEPVLDRFDVADDVQELPFKVVNDSLDAQRPESDDSIRKVQGDQDLLAEEECNVNGKKQEEVEASELSAFNSQQKAGKKGRQKIKTARHVEAVVRDALTIPGDAVEENETEQLNGHVEDSDESSFAFKGDKRNGRKRKTTTSEQDGDDSEGRSDSVKTGRNKKRRQKVNPAVQAPAEKRYNLRRQRNVPTVAPAATSSDFFTGKQRSQGGRVTSAENSVSRAGARTARAGSENGGTVNLVQDEAAAETNGGYSTPTRKQIESTVLSEEASEAPDGHHEHSFQTLDRDGDEDVGKEVEDDADDEDYEPEHRGEMSIGKRVWNFLTT